MTMKCALDYVRGARSNRATMCAVGVVYVVLAAVFAHSEARAAVPPSAPTSLSGVSTTCNAASLTWDASRPGELPLYAYKVYRDGQFFRWVNAPGTTAFDPGIAGAGTYHYTVIAVDTVGNLSAPSNVATVSTPPCGGDTTDPSVPTGLVASVVDCQTVSLGWRPSSDGTGFGVRGYRVYRDGAALQVVPDPTTSFTDTGAAPAARHAYAVSALDRAGNESALSTPAVATTPPCETPPPATDLPPSASAGPDQLTQTLAAVTFSAAGSSDPDDGIASYVWTFGDGSGGVGSIVTHQYL